MTSLATDGLVAIRKTGLGNTSYVLDVGGGLAVAVDPPRDVDAHLEAADRLGCRIIAALETHIHADYVSGARELAAAAGADVIAPSEASLRFAHRGVSEGDTLRLGDAQVRTLATPGHTPEHVSFFISVHGRDMIFSGGSLIGGGAARTDLIDAGLTESLARRQFHSLRRLAALSGTTRLLPTHGAGSFCSAARPADGRTSLATIAEERERNPLLAIDDEDTFVRTLLAGYGSFPPYFLRLRDVNRRGAELVRELAPPRALTPREVADAMRAGAVLVDARPIGEWAAGHARGSVSIAYRDQFASWLGWVVPFGAPVLLVADPSRVEPATRQARGIGYDAVAGWLDGGIDAWRDAGRPVDELPSIDGLQAERRAAAGAVLLDVRQDAEFAVSRIPGALHLELGDVIAGRAPAATEVITFCGHGERAATAASLLEAEGRRVAILPGGPEAWEAAGFPVER